MQSLTLFNSNTQRYIFYIALLFIAVFNLYTIFNNYKDFKTDEIFQDNFKIVNIYYKSKYNILKLKNNNFTCFTKIKKSITVHKYDTINIYLITKNVTFLKYIKNFYTNSFNLQIIPSKSQKTFKDTLLNYIAQQHHSLTITSLYQSLFLATSIPKELRDIFSSYGVSHLIAISGFHLGIISMVLYFMLNLLYTPIHQKYIPFRNKKFDLLIIVSIILFFYLLFIDLTPSFLRSFIMFIIGIIFLRSYIKILSFETLLIVVLIILALYPKLFFSLSLWFSVAGVFYIFLYLQYFNNINRYISFFLFNFWIFFAINPIVHFVFDTTSNMQLLSPLLTISFTLFYPIALILHIVGYGGLLDTLLQNIINTNIDIYSKFTSIEFFIIFVLLSLCSIKSKRCFILLNISIIIFNLYLFLL